jgi:hypothetical protein
VAEILTGNEIIDSLQNLQRHVDKLHTSAEKIECFKMARQPLGTHRLIGSSLMISTALAFGRGLDMPPDRLLKFGEGLMLTAKVERLDYVADPLLPLDSLILMVEEPSVFVEDPLETEAFSKLSLRIPILAIDTCVSLDLD